MIKVSADRIIEIINTKVENVKVSKEQIEDDLIELGIDSINFISMIVAIEEEYECEIPDEKLIISEMNTVKKITDVLNNIS